MTEVAPFMLSQLARCEASMAVMAAGESPASASAAGASSRLRMYSTVSAGMPFATRASRTLSEEPVESTSGLRTA
eukprot:9342303-Alexandrium_andersonii.AAC.1